MTSKPEEAARRVARVIGGVFICIGLYLCFNVFELKSEGIRSSGKVLEKNIVVFATEAGQGIKFGGNTWGFSRGATVTVLYLREDPQGSAMIERGSLEDAGYAWGALLYGGFLLYRFRGK